MSQAGADEYDPDPQGSGVREGGSRKAVVHPFPK